jgi:hypothetical protein
MTKTLALLLALTTAIPANAGGPVIEETEVAGDRDNRVPTRVMLALGVFVIAAISGRSDNCYAEDVPVEPTPPIGCR